MNRMRICGAALIGLCLLAAAKTGQAEIPAELKPNLLFYAPFDNGAEAQFARGNKTPVRLEGVTSVPGKINGAVQISGKAVCRYNPAGNFNPAQGTLLMWVKRGEGSDVFFTVGKEWYGPDFFTFRIVASQNNTHCAIRSRGEPIGGIDWKMVSGVGEWHNYALTWGNGSVTLYFDGQSVETRPMTGALEKERLGDAMWVGTGCDGLYPANSALDEFYLFDRALTGQEILNFVYPEKALAEKQRLEKRKSQAKLRKTFYLDFDQADPFQAGIAGGSAKSAINDKVELVPGLNGNGVLLKGQAILAYEEAGNIDKDWGSVEMWVKPQFDPWNQPPYPCFFKEDAPLGPIPTDNIWLWMPGGGIIRYDMRVSPYDILQANFPGGYKDIWHQLIITWDSRKGTGIFVDGQRAPFMSSDKPFGIMKDFQWEPVSHPRFFIGSRGRDTYHSATPAWGACDSVIDDFAIYNRPMTEAEALESFRKAGRENIAPYILVRRAAAIAGKEYQPVFDLKNSFPFELKGKLEIVLEGNGNPVPVMAQDVNLKSGALSTLTAGSLVLPQGYYNLIYRFNGQVRQRQSFSVLAAYNPPATEQVGEPKLIGRYDARDVRQTGENYRESAPAVVKTLDGAGYLEGADVLFGRMAFRFSVKNPGKPHLVKVFYPDDRERIFDIIVNSPNYPGLYDAQGGVLTGLELENTNRMQVYELLYWPREKDQALILTTWSKAAPAAIAAFEVYELGDRIPPAPMRAFPKGEHRMLGLYWEDPMLTLEFGSRPIQNVTAANSKLFVEETADRMIDYLKWTGMNTLIYPAFFYQGPGFMALSENLITGSGFDRHPDNYLDILLSRFDEAGFGFIPEVNCDLSPSLLLPVRDFVNRPEAGYLTVDNKGNRDFYIYPRLNVLHPLYQEKVLNQFQEVCRRFGGSPAFKGLQLHLVYESSFWFGGAEFGYDDYSVNLFQTETGVKVPDFKTGNKYQQRYEWLMREQKDAWLDWRCGKLTEFYTKLAKALSDTRPDLKLILGLRYISEGDSRLSDWEKEGRSMKNVYRNCGIDFEKMYRIKNLEIQKYFYSADIKWARIYHPEQYDMYAGLELRRSPELQKTLTLDGAKTAGVNIYVNYFESAIGRDEPIKNLWWKDPEWRVSGPNPSGRNFLELFAESVAGYDAPLITNGGFIVGPMGCNQQIREFALAYCPLPAEKFNTVYGFSDTAVLRWSKSGYVYAVNRAPFPVTLKLHSDAALDLTGISDNSGLQGTDVSVELKPYQLRSFKGYFNPLGLKIVDYGIPAERRQMILDAGERLKAKGAKGQEIARRLEQELAKLNYVKCKYILEEPATMNLLYRK